MQAIANTITFCYWLFRLLDATTEMSRQRTDIKMSQAHIDAHIRALSAALRKKCHEYIRNMRQVFFAKCDSSVKMNSAKYQLMFAANKDPAFTVMISFIWEPKCCLQHHSCPIMFSFFPYAQINSEVTKQIWKLLPTIFQTASASFGTMLECAFVCWVRLNSRLVAFVCVSSVNNLIPNLCPLI